MRRVFFSVVPLTGSLGENAWLPSDCGSLTRAAAAREIEES